MITLDFDDFSHRSLANGELDLLDRLHEAVPGLKVTLFTIPYLPLPAGDVAQSVAWLRLVAAARPWMEFALHGWTHGYKECAAWTREQASGRLAWAEDTGLFVRGFKAPYWEMGLPVYEALLERDWWIADHHRNDALRPPALRAYLLDGPDRVHGHVGDTQGNGLSECFELYQALRGPFQFVSEVMAR